MTLIDRYDLFENERKQVRSILDVALHKPQTDQIGWCCSLRNYDHDMDREGIPSLDLPKEHIGLKLGTLKSRNDSLAGGDS